MDQVKIEIGQELLDDLYSSSNILLLRKGTVINEIHMRLLAKYDVKTIKRDSIRQKPLSEEEKVKKVYQETLSKLKEQYASIYKKEVLTSEDATSIKEAFSGLVTKDNISLIQLKEQLSQDEYLYQHSLNVGLVARKIGQVLYLSKNEQNMLAQMGIFHDVGKFKIDPAILNKPGRLTDEEFEIMKRHPQYGYNLLKEAGIPQEILLGTLMHHERLDGTGYPNKVSSHIPFLVRILSVADTFDAICSRRVYKDNRSIFFAVDELIKDARGNRLDIDVVIPFANYLMEALKERKIPLRNGKTAEIRHVFPDRPNQPILEVEGYLPLNLKESGLTLLQVASV